MTIHGDLKKTQEIYDLVSLVAPSIRTQAWNAKFLEILPGASFCCGEPQVIMGPD